MLFYCNNGCKNTPQCYVVRALPVFCNGGYTCNVASDTIRSYELNSHPIPHGVVTCERYTTGFRVCYGSPSDTLQLAAASYFYILYALKKKGGGGGKRNCTQAWKCTAVQVCWQTWIFSRSVGIYKNFPRMSPSEFELLINLIWGKKSRKRTQRSGKPFLFKKGWHWHYFSWLVVIRTLAWVPLQNFLSLLHFTITNTLKKPHSTTDSHHPSRQKHQEWKGQRSGRWLRYVSRCPSTPAQAVTVSSLWCDGQIPTAHRTSP